MDRKEYLDIQLRLALAEIDYWRQEHSKIDGPDLDTGWLRGDVVSYQIGALKVRIAELRSMINA